MAVDEAIPIAETPAVPRPVSHLTDAESKAKGKEARAKVPRDSQAEFTAWPERPDPVALLEEQAESRVP